MNGRKPIFIHYVHDMKRAQRFYESVFDVSASFSSSGWTILNFGSFELALHILSGSDMSEAPLPHAGLNLEVDRIEEMQALIEQNGGRMIDLREPVPHVPVRVATFRDPEGNGFDLRQHVGQARPLAVQGMLAKRLTPILNVSDIQQSFAWFEKLGWQKGWDWGSPPSFGGVCSGECEIFLCQGGQGGRGKGANQTTFGSDDGEVADKGVWMSIWVDNVDAINKRCLEQGLDVTWPPTNMEWNVREMHVRHPDGHVFRISQGIGEE